MAKVKPMGLIESMSGKVCEHSDVYFFRHNGKIFTGKRCHPSTKAPTEAQTAQQKHPRRHCLDGTLAHAVARKRSDKNRHRASLDNKYRNKASEVRAALLQMVRRSSRPCIAATAENRAIHLCAFPLTNDQLCVIHAETIVYFTAFGIASFVFAQINLED